MINLDGSTPMPPHRLTELITAILEAKPEDECDWAEWKSRLDLGNRQGQLTLARSILGFANRNPETSQRPFAGTAYMVIGAEPGQLVGVQPLDLSVLQPKVAHYLGNPGPFWRHHYVTPVEDPTLTVPVVEIPAPRPGEMPYPLAHEGVDDTGKTVMSGTLFIRRGSKTERANYDEVLMLGKRAAQRSAPKKITDLEIITDINVESQTLHALDTSTAVIDQWLQQRRQRLLEKTQEDAPRPRGLTWLWSEHEIRAYSDSVDTYLEECRPYLKDAFAAAFLKQGYNSISIGVINPSDEHLADVEIVLTLPPSCFVVDPASVAPGRLPTPVLAELSGVGIPPRVPITADAIARTAMTPREASFNASHRCIDKGAHVAYTETVGDIRPRAYSHTCTIQLWIDSAVINLDLKIAVTSPPFPGRAEYSISIPVERTKADFTAKIIDPDPNGAVPGRRFPVTHNHHHRPSPCNATQMRRSSP